jgi:MFS transporter, UMF1 family
VQTFLFAPYSANAIVKNSACGTLIAQGSEKAAWGQALWGYAASVAGLLIAILSPLTVAALVSPGRMPYRWCFLAGLSTLWLGEPGIGFSTILIVLAGFVAGRLSGTDWAVGYFGGLASLALVAGFLVPMPGEAKTLLRFDPALNLDVATHQADRITGPFAAIWFAIFIIRFFLFVADRRAAVPLGHPKRSPAAEL